MNTIHAAEPADATNPAVRRFDTICLIVNPHSTGDAPELAAKLRDQLTEGLPYSPEIRMLPTEHAGHAVDLAKEAAGTPNALVVSVSGDGGYNEVVNGVMAAGSTDAVCAVVTAGNANDHHRTTARQPLAEAVAEGRVRKMDLLHLSTGNHPGAEALYAHSYIGFGLTPVVAMDSRAVIDLAVGIIMGRNRCSQHDSLEVRTAVSRHRNRKRHQVAADLVAVGGDPATTQFQS